MKNPGSERSRDFFWAEFPPGQANAAKIPPGFLAAKFAQPFLTSGQVLSDSGMDTRLAGSVRRIL